MRLKSGESQSPILVICHLLVQRVYRSKAMNLPGMRRMMLFEGLAYRCRIYTWHPRRKSEGNFLRWARARRADEEVVWL